MDRVSFELQNTVEHIRIYPSDSDFFVSSPYEYGMHKKGRNKRYSKKARKK